MLKRETERGSYEYVVLRVGEKREDTERYFRISANSEGETTIGEQFLLNARSPVRQ